MKVIIPMAGFGKRLRPHTYSRPKPLIPVAGKPLLGHIMDQFADVDVDEFVFIVGYLGDQVEKYVSENYDVQASFVEQRELLGQAHALWLAREHLSGPVVILFVDTVCDADLSRLDRADADAIAFVKEVDDPRRFGVVVLDDDGYVTRFIEKPDTMENKLAVIGFYYLKEAAQLVEPIKELLDRQIRTKGEYYLADAFQLMIESGARFRTERVRLWLDCGKPETVLETNRALLERGADNSEQAHRDGVVIVPPVYIAPDAYVSRSVIGPYVSIGSKAVVENSIVRDSIIDERTQVTDSFLESSLIGREAVIRGKRGRLNVGDNSVIA